MLNFIFSGSDEVQREMLKALDPVPMRVGCWGISTALSSFQASTGTQLNSILKLSAWREQQIPQVKGSVLQNRPHPLQTTIASPGHHL